MNRRQVLLSALGATSPLASASTVFSTRLEGIAETSRLALQTNSETSPPNFETLPWSEVMYVGMLATWYDVFRDGLTTFFDGLDSLRNDLGNMGMRAKVAGVPGVWAHLHQDVASISPPVAFTEPHEHFLDALSELNAIADAIAVGMIEGDADLLTSSIDGMDAADASLRSFVAALPYAVPDRRELGF